MSDAWAQHMRELERRVEADPGDEVFSLLAECYRRNGRIADAEAVARRGLGAAPGSVSGLAVLTLVLMDAGRESEARSELEQRAAAGLAAWRPQESVGAAAPSPETAEPETAEPGEGQAYEATAAPEAPLSLSADELDRAFDTAEPELDAMITPDRLAEEAALRVDEGAAEPAAAGTLEESSEVLELGEAFSTRTMAELLEQQGDREGAARIRASLGAAPAAEAPASEAMSPDTRIVAVLEHWLENVRRLAT